MPAKRGSKLECGGTVVAARASVGPVRKRARQRSVVILREGRTFADQHGNRHRREMQPVWGREMWFARTKEQIRTRHFCSAQAASSGVSTSSATKLRRGRKGKAKAWKTPVEGRKAASGWRHGRMNGTERSSCSESAGAVTGIREAS
ncbi:hypothetical protein ERJ75_000690900 [Trypanosoma vivax]|nr:hypothetical protein ERJ75_000690900 [Trypanosoma vivax]